LFRAVFPEILKFTTHMFSDVTTIKCRLRIVV